MGDTQQEYLEFFDVEEENLRDYNEDTTSMVQNLDTGEIFPLYQDRFKVLTCRDGFPSSCYVAPIGSIIVEVPLKDAYPTFDEYMSKYVQAKKDEEYGRYGYWDNPNKRWDWYLIGGRWTGYFKLKPRKLLTSDSISFDSNGFTLGEIQNFISMYNTDRNKLNDILTKYGKEKSISIAKAIHRYSQEIYPEHTVGSTGVMTPPAKIGYADSTYKKYIDFEGMREDARVAAETEWGTAMAVLGPSLSYFVRWDFVRKEMFKEDINKARDYYNNQEAIQLAWKHVADGVSSEIESYLCTKEEFINRRVNSAIPTFAVVKDYEWYERGEMGWWGIVSDEKDEDEWNGEFNKMLDSLSEDTLLTVVDAHI